MKKITISLFLLSLFCLLSFPSCNKEESSKVYKSERQLSLPSTLYNYSNISFSDRIGFNEPSTLGLTDAGATLGRVLFYDTKLSLSNEISCESCHQQHNGFSDAKALSDGVINTHTPRNSQSIINCITEETFFWDSRVHSLEELVLEPILNHNELGFEKIEDLVSKLKHVDYYPDLFNQSFGTPEISQDRIASALSQFLNAMYTANSKFDLAEETENDDLYTAAEFRGKQVFETKANCDNCHGGFDLRGSWGEDWANIGLDEVYVDKGLGADGSEFQEGMFKVPSLRNIEVTGPYMHDGRFQSLEEVVDHYSEGVVDHPNLDWRLTNGGGNTLGFNLTNSEKKDLVAFLKTFTDQSFLTDIRFSDPFKQ